jgi:ribosome biogenesis GTPase
LSAQIDSRLAALGWDSWFIERFAAFAAEGLSPCRVMADYGAEYLVHDGESALRAAAGRHLRNGAGQLPAVGDWVALLRRDPISAVHDVVERKTVFSRKVAYVEAKEQVLAANVDVAFVVASAQDVNSRRVERYLTMAWQSGASPVVVLTKADLVDSTEDFRLELESVAMGTPVLITSAVTGEGVSEMFDQLRPSRTGVLLGPSGVGKSSLINRIAGSELMKTREVHSSGQGRHMTSHRELIQLPGGGMIIDTPGLREAQLWQGGALGTGSARPGASRGDVPPQRQIEEVLGNLFEDVEQIALGCKFSDCEHRSEPGCAIKAAIARGELDVGRLESYRKLQRELRAVAARSDERLLAESRRKWKQIAVANRARTRILGR